MLFDKQAVIDHIAQQVGPEQAQQAAQMLPDQVDHEQHGQLLQELGIDPQNMVAQLGAQFASQVSGYGSQGQGQSYDDQDQGGHRDQDDRGGS